MSLPADPELYHRTIDICAEYGLQQYEVSNFARPGAESQHNLAYWRGLDYVGVGPGAVGIYHLNPWSWLVCEQIKSVDAWMADVDAGGLGNASERSRSVLEAAKDTWRAVGRTREGLCLRRFQDEFKVDVRELMEKDVRLSALCTAELLRLEPCGVCSTRDESKPGISCCDKRRDANRASNNACWRLVPSRQGLAVADGLAERFSLVLEDHWKLAE